MSTIHHLGNGYGPHVDEIDGKIMFSLPVESSFVSLSFQFEISREDLAILKNNPEKMDALFDALHSEIQNTFGPSVPKEKVRHYTQGEFDVVKKRILGI